MNRLPSAPQLLVSVRSLEEARQAAAAGCGILDLKEPDRGSLGRVDSQIAADVVRELSGTLPLSLALGEVTEWETSPAHLELPAGFSFLKLGLSGLGSDRHWPQRWLTVRTGFETTGAAPDAQWIAVVYADHQIAKSPPPSEIIAAAADTGCAGVLFDTFAKSAGSLLDHLPVDRLAEYAADVQRHGLLLALAGSLREQHLPHVLPLGPDVVAVRGAVCRAGDRTGELDPDRIARLANALQTQSQPATSVIVPDTAERN